MIGISINKKSYDMNKVWMSVSFFHTHTHIFDQWKQIQENTFCFKNRNENSDEKLIVNDDFHPQVGMYQCQLITYGKTNE